MFLGGTCGDNALLHISDSMDALEAVRPSMFKVSAVVRLCLFTADIVWVVWFDVLEEFADYLTLSSNLVGIPTSTLLP